MSYSSLDDLKRRISEAELIQLTDDQGLGQIDQTLVSGAIAESDGLVDSFVRAQTAVPLSDPPEVIRLISADLTLYRLYTRRGLSVNEEVVSLKDKAFSMLEKIAKGELKILATDNAAFRAATKVKSQDADFTPDLLSRY